MTLARQRLGRSIEEAVARRLAAGGWELIARNARPSEVRGELDLVARDGDELVFVEVKGRRAGARYGPETPATTVGRRKQAKLRSLAVAWLRENRALVPSHGSLRFDVVGVVVGAGGEPLEWEHLRAAF